MIPGDRSAGAHAATPLSQAVMLAAGRGSRTGALCADRPKALLSLAGRSLLDRNIEALCDAGVRRLCIVGGWQIEALQAWRRQQADLLRARDLQIEIIEQPRWASTGPVGSLRCADAWLSRAPTLVLYGDCVYAPQTLRGAVAGFECGLRVPGDRRWSALWRQRFAAPLDDAERWRSVSGRLIEIGGRAESLDAERAQFMGLCLLEPAAWTGLHEALRAARLGAEAVDRLDFTALFAQLLHSGVQIDCVELDGGWLEVDSTEDLALYEAEMARTGEMHGLQA